MLFMIHSTLVADHSAPLAALINRPMCKARDGVGELEDTTEDTFIRFCKYAYMGDYMPAQHDIVPAASQVDRKTSPIDNKYFETLNSKKKEKGQKPI